jgi:hypothetical protein
MSLDSVRSAPFFLPIFSRVRSIFPFSSSSLSWDGVAAVDPSGKAAQRAKGTATHAMRNRNRRIGVRGRVGDRPDAEKRRLRPCNGRGRAQETFRIA